MTNGRKQKKRNKEPLWKRNVQSSTCRLGDLKSRESVCHHRKKNLNGGRKLFLSCLFLPLEESGKETKPLATGKDAWDLLLPFWELKCHLLFPPHYNLDSQLQWGRGGGGTPDPPDRLFGGSFELRYIYFKPRVWISEALFLRSTRKSCEIGYTVKYTASSVLDLPPWNTALWGGEDIPFLCWPLYKLWSPLYSIYFWRSMALYSTFIFIYFISLKYIYPVFVPVSILPTTVIWILYGSLASLWLLDISTAGFFFSVVLLWVAIVSEGAY